MDFLAHEDFTLNPCSIALIVHGWESSHRGGYVTRDSREWVLVPHRGVWLSKVKVNLSPCLTKHHAMKT